MKEKKQNKSKNKVLMVEAAVRNLTGIPLVEKLEEALVGYFVSNKIFDYQEVARSMNDVDTLLPILCTHITKNKTESKKKIKWKGTQKQLGELLIELNKKGWIEGLEYGNIKEFALSVDNAFSFTVKDNNTNSALSIYQILKPQQSKEENYISLHPQIFTPQYSPKFTQIKSKKEK